MAKSREELSGEVDYLKHYTEKFYTAPVNAEMISETVLKIIEERLTDYLYQRFRDWQAHDLLALAHLFVELEVFVTPTIEELNKLAVVEQSGQDEKPKRRRKNHAKV